MGRVGGSSVGVIQVDRQKHFCDDRGRIHTTQSGMTCGLNKIPVFGLIIAHC